MNTGKLVLAISAVLVSGCQSQGAFRLLRSAEVPNPAEYAASYGYYSETHDVLTPDGYILTLHRVLSPKIDLRTTSPEPFILQHGLFCNAGQWNVLEPRQNLVYMLADEGLDIWMTNIRGNMYSRKHESLSPESSEFWDYSWHEHGTIDMPAIIDYILNTTKHKQVWYSGHSMGTTMFFVMTSMRPQYNRKIRHMFALAPVAYMSHLEMPVRHIAGQERVMEIAGKSAFNNHFQTDFIVAQFSRFGICRAMLSACSEVTNAGAGYNPRSNSTSTNAMFNYFPDYASVRQVSHYAQLINNHFTFRMYDYFEQNILRYTSVEPPRYPAEKITAPMTFIYSANDYFAAVVDVEAFAKHLKNVRMFLIPDHKFNHLDFVTSTYADEVVYKPMLKMIDDLRQNNKRRQ